MDPNIVRQAIEQTAAPTLPVPFAPGQPVYDPANVAQAQGQTKSALDQMAMENFFARANSGAFARLAPPPAIQASRALANAPVAAPAPMQLQAPAMAVPKPARASLGVSKGTPGPDELEKGMIDAGRSEQAALTAQGQTQADSATAEAAAFAEAGQTRADLAGELADKQASNRAHIEELDKQDKANLEQARATTIPDFWEGRTGDLVGATISVALSGAASALLGSNQNQALSAINQNVDSYFREQKSKVDNAFKFASESKSLNDTTRRQYAQELLNLKDQHTYTLDAVKDHIMEVAAMSKSDEALAKAEVMAAAIDKQIVADRLQVRTTRAHLLNEERNSKASAAAAYANARQSDAATAKLKAEAAAGPKTAQPTESQNKLAQFASEGQGAIKVLQANGMPSEDSLRTYLANKDKMSDADASKGLLAAPGKSIGRFVGYLPTSLYQDIPEKEQQGLRAYEQLQEAIARTHSGGAIGKDEDYRFARMIMPQPGDAPAVVQQKYLDAQKYVSTAMALSGPAQQIIQNIPQNVAQDSGQVKAQLQQWIAGNPNDPRVAQAKARLQAM